MPIIRTGNVVGPEDLLASLPKAAFRVRSWQDSCAPKSRHATYDALRANDAMGETIFDGSHGRRFLLFAYGTTAERKACFDFLCAPESLP